MRTDPTPRLCLIYLILSILSNLALSVPRLPCFGQTPFRLERRLVLCPMPGGGIRVRAANTVRAKKTPAELAKIRQEAAARAAEAQEEEEDEKPKGKVRRCLGSVMDFLDQTWLQTLQYILFLYTFQSLVGTLRKSEEFYLDKYITDTFITNTFDINHNTLASIRRTADIWEWTSNVFVPGLFSNADAGEWWPDGDGSFSLQGATPLSTSDMVNEMNAFDWTQGIIFKQARASYINTHSHPCAGWCLAVHVRRPRHAPSRGEGG